MKKIILTALAASAAAISVPAAAQLDTTGTITLEGYVTAKCAVRTTGATTFGETVDFNELAAANGTLRSGLSAEFATRYGSVVCTSSNPTVSVEAQPLAADNYTGPPPTGYADEIDFDAHVAVVATGTNQGPFNRSSTLSGASTPAAVGSPLANQDNNILITADNFNTNGNNTDILVADTSYTGKVIVTVAPGA